LTPRIFFTATSIVSAQVAQVMFETAKVAVRSAANAAADIVKLKNTTNQSCIELLLK
jgi:sialic acid synthase SpsE